MHNRFIYRSILITLIGMAGSFYANAQQQPVKLIRSGAFQSLRNENILRVQSDTVDGKIIQAQFSQGFTIMDCDSAILDQNANAVEAYGNVHVNDKDSVHTYSDYIFYDGNTRIVTLDGNAKMTDRKVIITGPEMIYDMNAKIGSYVNGGKLVNEKSTLTSQEAFYYTDTKDVYFKQNVVLINPDYTLSTDTLLYNTATKIATIVAPTTINDGKRITYVSSGTYNTETGKGNFVSRPLITDSTGDFTADHIDIDKSNGMAIATGNMIWRDTVNKIILLGNYGQVNQTSKSVFATQHPVAITYNKADSLFMTGDTLYSGLISPDTAKVYLKDSLLQTVPPAEENDSLTELTVPADSVASAFKQRADAAIGIERDSITAAAVRPDSIQQVVRPTRDSIPVRTALPPENLRKFNTDTLPMAKLTDTTAQQPKDTTEKRYIRAFRNVRIYSDSLQAVCDSAYYSSVDSVLRMFRSPVIWVKDLQMSGDTAFLFTRNTKADRLLLDQNGLLASEVNKGFYNQIKGNTITGYFRENKLFYMRIYGNAESILFQQDSDSAFTNVQRSTCAIIDMHFIEGELDRVVNIKDHEGALYPFTQFPADQRLLSNFKWEIKRKPKSRYELIGN